MNYLNIYPATTVDSFSAGQNHFMIAIKEYQDRGEPLVRKGDIIDGIPYYANYDYVLPVYFYKVSEDPIQVGDLVLNTKSKFLHSEVCTIDNQTELENYANVNPAIKKVVATTERKYELIPSIPGDIIEAWVELNNDAVFMKHEVSFTFDEVISLLESYENDKPSSIELAKWLRDYRRKN